jgi:hypothetical protein
LIRDGADSELVFFRVALNKLGERGVSILRGASQEKLEMILMKRYFELAMLLVAATCGLHAQVIDTTVCDVLKSPQSFDNKIVRIKGTVVAGFDQFVIRDENCAQDVNGIWLAYPQGTKGKAGPMAMLELKPAKNFAGTAAAPTARAAVVLDKSKDFKEFDNKLAELHSKGTALCMGCVQNTVMATVVGRLDGVASATFKRDASGKITTLGGFGSANTYPARLVIQSVSDVVAKPVDFAKVDAITAADNNNQGPGQQQSGSNPLADAQKFAAAMNGKPMGDQFAKAVGVFAKPGEQNGVVIGYGAMNEAAQADAPSTQDSPDGLEYHVTFNKDKIKPEAMEFALLHMGQHIADIRTPVKGNESAPPRVSESNAWVVSSEAAIWSGQRYVILPGAYMMWNGKWPQPEQVQNMQDALKQFLDKEVMMNM